MTKTFRGCTYNIEYVRSEKEKGIEVDGKPVDGNLLPINAGKTVKVKVLC